MAEPVSSLPVSPPKNEPIPWPENTRHKTDEPRPEALLPEGAGAASGIQRAWNDIRRSTVQVAKSVRGKMSQLRRERPLQVIAAVAVASFGLGCALRIWRSRYE
jgi:hypothetical protein